MEKLEREYIIPLRAEWAKVPRYKRANKAIKAIKEFLVRHMKIRDRDLKKIKIDTYLNEEVWFRGIKKPPAKIKVKAIKIGDEVRVELVDYADKLKFKKLRQEKIEKEAKAIVESKKKTLDKMKEATQKVKKEEPEATEEEKTAPLGVPQSTESRGKEKEKKASVIEAGEKMQKEAAKKAKHEVVKSAKQPKRPVRQSLKK